MERINNYKIIKPILFSNDSTTYEAFDEWTNRRVAIKIFTSDVLISNFRQKLKFDPILLGFSSLYHENINTLLDLIIIDDCIAIISEYLIGKTLDELLIEKGRLPIVDFTLLLNQIISAFYYAHEIGGIHGNLTPSNIFIQENGNIKILGIGERYLFGNNYTSEIQNQGVRCFITPEEFINGTDLIDYQSDIYCVGLILFYALTGLKPNFNCGFLLSENKTFNPFPNYDYTESEKKFELIIKKACQLKKHNRFDSFKTLQKDSLTNSNYNITLPKADRSWLQKLFGAE